MSYAVETAHVEQTEAHSQSQRDTHCLILKSRAYPLLGIPVTIIFGLQLA
jgi:hypothetical protein